MSYVFSHVGTLERKKEKKDGGEAHENQKEISRKKERNQG